MCLTSVVQGQISHWCYRLKMSTPKVLTPTANWVAVTSYNIRMTSSCKVSRTRSKQCLQVAAVVLQRSTTSHHWDNTCKSWNEQTKKNQKSNLLRFNALMVAWLRYTLRCKRFFNWGDLSVQGTWRWLGFGSCMGSWLTRMFRNG